MTRTLALVLSFCILTATAVRASESVVVVELFTSQGCSSCPPADAFLHELAQRDDVLAVALHVDYWDYIGWQDVFGQAAWSKRQRNYANIGGRNWVYTPQMMINGVDDVPGSKPQKVEALIGTHAAKPPVMALEAHRDGNRLRISGSGRAGTGGPYLVQLFRYMPQQEVKITRGENAGRTLKYTNILTRIDTLATWDGKSTLALEAPITGEEPGLIIIQANGPGPIIAAVAVE